MCGNNFIYYLLPFLEKNLFLKETNGKTNVALKYLFLV